MSQSKTDHRAHEANMAPDEFIEKVALTFYTRGQPYTLVGLLTHIQVLKKENDILRDLVVFERPAQQELPNEGTGG